LFVLKSHTHVLHVRLVWPGLSLYQIWTKGELDYDLGLEKWGIEIDMNAANTINFLCFIEPWEHEATKKQSAANEFRLIQKYKVLLLFDNDDYVD
jgi:hypothetical protein